MLTAMRSCALSCAVAVLCPGVSSAAEFYGLGQNDLAVGVSPDGSTVLTTGNVWTPAGGFVPYLTETLLYSRDISNNGYVVGLVDGSYVAARTPIGGPLQELESPSRYSDANAITPDGRVVVGYAYGANGPEAFRWTEAGGLVGLGRLSAVSTAGDAAYGVSADGSVVVGASESAPETLQAFRWTQSTGMVGLGDLPGGTFNSTAQSISNDGRVIVGFGTGASGLDAIRWTEAGGMVALGDLPGGDVYSRALAADFDGRTIVGEARTANDAFAFVWTPTDGMRRLQDVLIAEHGLGPQLANWTLNNAYDISDDGRTIVGYGTGPSGKLEGFVAVVPEPSAAAAGFIGMSAMGLARRRGRNGPLKLRCQSGMESRGEFVVSTPPVALVCMAPYHIPSKRYGSHSDHP